MSAEKTNNTDIFRQRILTLISFLFIALLFIGLYWFFIGRFEESVEANKLNQALYNLSFHVEKIEN